jgi:hypothetical protein
MRLLLITTFLLLGLGAFSQVVSRSAIGSGGDHFEQVNFSLSVTIGEFSGFSYFENECLSISTGVQHADEFIPCFGDFDYNHEVNVSDLLLLNANYGLTGPCIDGDLDQDQKVKVSDVLIFFGAYGDECD